MNCEFFRGLQAADGGHKHMDHNDHNDVSTCCKDCSASNIYDCS